MFNGISDFNMNCKHNLIERIKKSETLLKLNCIR